MPAELAWTQEIPTKPGLYVSRHAEAWPGALLLWKLPTGELRDDQGFDYDDDDLAPEGMEFLGPLPE